MAGPSLMDSLFQRTLEDLIKGLRLYIPGGESAFISKAVDEIRREIKSTDLQTKSTALQKLTYLHSLHGLDMSWAAFHAVEVTSSQSFSEKKIGYLAASLSFHSTTEVLLLLTNQLRKDLSSVNEFEVSLALECLSNICTPDLARDLTPDVFTLLGTSKNFVRKKAIAMILRLFTQYPDAVRVCFKRLVENLEGSDIQVVSSTVSVFCELASGEPKSYLPLAPEFYRILVDSRNNWVLIKVLKVFANLAPLEPRLAKKVVEPICEIMRRTGAKSLVFECVRTILTSLSDYESAVNLAVTRIREFLIDEDPNLKYLGLQALLLVAPKHLWVVLDNKDVVIRSLSDTDSNVKLEALRLVMAMVSEDNVAEMCRVLINYALKSDPEFCNEILGSILSTCSRNLYEVIIDFDWYVSLLGEMSRIPHCQKGEQIENQLIDIGMRVKDVRPTIVRVGSGLLIDPALLGNPFIHRILCAAAWVSGEYVQFSKNPFELMEALLQPRTNLLPPSIRAVYIQSALKLLSFCVYSYLLPSESAFHPVDLGAGETDSVFEREPEDSDSVSCEPPTDSKQEDGFNPRSLGQSAEGSFVANDGDTFVTTHGETSSSAHLNKDLFTRISIVNLLNLVETSLLPLAGSHEVEIQERVRNVMGLIELIKRELPDCFLEKEEDFDREEVKVPEMIKLMYDSFSEELGPVSLSAQERVPIPDGIVLEENLKNLEAICSDIQLPIYTSFTLGKPHYAEREGVSLSSHQNKEESDTSASSQPSLLAEHRKRHGLYYLPAERKEEVSPDYPPANEPKQLQSNVNDDTEDLVRLTDRSLIPKKKLNQAKPRPVVVKLDEGDVVPFIVKKPVQKDDMVSGAVRDVLLGDEAVNSLQSNLSEKSLSNTKGKEKLNVGNEGKTERRTKHREDRKQKSSHRRSRQKARQREDGGSQTPVIPDFLL